VKFLCPMHSQTEWSEPGTCPKCGMTLVEQAHEQSRREPMAQMAREHYTPYRWVQAVVSALGLWLIMSPSTLGHGSSALRWSDLVSGTVVLGLSLLALGARRGWASWAAAGVGVWLLAAPLVFWAPPAAYVNDTLVGTMLVVFGFLIPMGMRMPGPAIPPGWSYNPSSWPQRAPIITLAVVSFFAARYMAAFQLGHIDSVWEPFFGDGTRRVLTSDVSRAWPVSDAGLGAMTYLIEALMGFMGDERRWRTMPWMVAGFGIVVIPLGIVSIVLVILQPLAVGAWCSLCLFTAAAMLVMIPLTLDEVVAMVQFVARRRREGASAWHVFWYGGNLPDDTPVHEPTRPVTWRPKGMGWGLSASWPLLASTAAGVWLMFAPAAFGSAGAMADSDHLVGALVVVVSVISLAEVARPGRFLNLLLGAFLVTVPWWLEGGSSLARANSALIGVAIILLGLPLGRIRDHYGSFDGPVRWTPRRAH
jgi:hypothetical protein